MHINVKRATRFLSNVSKVADGIDSSIINQAFFHNLCIYLNYQKDLNNVIQFRSTNYVDGRLHNIYDSCKVIL